MMDGLNEVKKDKINGYLIIKIICPSSSCYSVYTTKYTRIGDLPKVEPPATQPRCSTFPSGLLAGSFRTPDEYPPQFPERLPWHRT